MTAAIFKAWSASRLDDYLKCPAMARYKHLDKLCTECFEGKIMGGFDTPAMCDTCGKTIVKGDALVRGDEIGTRLDAFLTGKAKTPGPTIRHPTVLEIVNDAKAKVKKKVGFVQCAVALTRKWEVWKGEPWSPQVWLRAKLDFLIIEGAVARVIDWKTGGIDKRTGEVRANEKYDDQLDLYNVVTLAAYHEVQGVTSALVFLDTGPRFNPLVERNSLARKEARAMQRKFEVKIGPMMADRDFAPKANGSCGYCPYGKGKGGPCKF